MSEPRPQGAVLQLPAQEGNVSQQDSLTVSPHRQSSMGAWHFAVVLLVAPWPTRRVLDVLTGNVNFIWVLLVVMVFKGKSRTYHCTEMGYSGF